jgi:hypothetical protein
MAELTGRVSFCVAAVALILGAGCSERSALLASGGASGGEPGTSGGSVGSGGYAGAALSGAGGTDGSGGIASSGGVDVTPSGTGGRVDGSGGVKAVGGYWGGDGIAPRGGGGTPAFAGGSPSGGRGGTGGVDTNCFMRCGQGNTIYASGGAGGSRDAGSGGSDGSASPGGDANDCGAKLQTYYAAVAAAEQCDPTATSPCTGYDGVECPTVGVNPDAVASLSEKLAEYKASGCSLPLHSCPVVVMTPPPYTCQPGADAGFQCHSVCEQMMGGQATCLPASACTHVVLNGFCAGASTVCCSPS